MTIALVGDPDEARGFALAGVRTYAPDTADTRAVLAGLTRDPSVDLVLISASVARFVPDVIDAHMRAGTHPAFLIVPSGAAEGALAEAP